MAWISFGALPCREKKTSWQLTSRCWNRARPWHASELVSFLVRLRTYRYVTSQKSNSLIRTYYYCEFARRRSMSSALLSSVCIYKLGKWCQLLASSARKPWSVQPTCWVSFGLAHYIELWWVMLVPGIEVSEVCTSFVILNKQGALKLSASSQLQSTLLLAFFLICFTLNILFFVFNIIFCL